MAGETALDTSIAIRYLNGDQIVVNHVLALPTVVLPLTVVGELLFGAENSARSLQNLRRYLQFIDACTVVPAGRETAAFYSRSRLALKRKGRPIPENDIWIAAQCLEHGWKLATDDAHFSLVDGLEIEQW
ncbi:MAG: type II toxin-antitoxin system VapC family toxin [Oscillatoria princeps RMCB-10]|jgi:tRNA(fMet)-specific endonuclease VapC|nr:type II toxin-antitoxin system VapC family toxin [Oscillatoria princeps RMCB-10]